jgi:hypothetical protein
MTAFYLFYMLHDTCTMPNALSISVSADERAAKLTWSQLSCGH